MSAFTPDPSSPGTDHEANLIALAKMYGEACGELQVLRALARDVADEAAFNESYEEAHSDALAAVELLSRQRKAAEAEASKLRADLHESAMQHIARDVADEQAWGEIATLRERVAKLEEALKAQQWKRTGSSTCSMNGVVGTHEWFRPSDGRRESYPYGFDPNVGACVGLTFSSDPEKQP